MPHLALLARFFAPFAWLVFAGSSMIDMIRLILIFLAFLAAIALTAFIRGEQVKRVQQDACTTEIYNLRGYDFAEGWIQ